MCTREMTAYENPSGGRPIFGHEATKQGLREIKLPCGKCPECQKEYYTNWATRGHYELKRWSSSIFIHLTFSDEHVPPDNSLDKTTVQKFIKRVKKHFHSSKENPIRQIYCGEYGTLNGRPHFHVILFNCDFPDRYFWKMSDCGRYKQYRSPTLEKLWPYGHCQFGDADAGSIAYVFKYVLKKKTRKEKEKGPLIVESNGITYEVAHEFVEASRNPGIGAHLKNSSSIRKGYLSVNGVKQRLPKYLLEHIKQTDPRLYEDIKDKRFDHAQTKPKESALRKEQKEYAQKLLTHAKKKL